MQCEVTVTALNKRPLHHRAFETEIVIDHPVEGAHGFGGTTPGQMKLYVCTIAVKESFCARLWIRPSQRDQEVGFNEDLLHAATAQAWIVAPLAAGATS